MKLVGLDFSLNSPAACIYDGNDYTFISFFNFGNRDWDNYKKIPKAFSLHKELSDNKTIMAIPYNRNVTSKDFIIRERQKLNDGQLISTMILNTITNLCDDNVNIGLEGFSYGSKGNSFIDIVQYNTFLRSLILSTYGSEKINIYQPSHVKKLAGKGNANKHYMIKSFQDDVLNDNDLRKTKLWKWMKGKDFSKDIPKPIDDLIDSYFILKCLSNQE